MQHRKMNCAERREYESLIAALVQSVCRNSVSASKIAKGEGWAAEFEALRLNFSSDSIRLDTLRECLSIHIEHHGCGM
jgi:hypothetical protein